MAEIDSYQHELIGFVKCPMSFKLFGRNSALDKLPVYRLKESVTDGQFVSGQRGDILIGGGSGETHALSFAVPDIFAVCTTSKPACREPIFICHWTIAETFIVGSGFQKVGWNPELQPFEIWLAEHLIAFLIKTRSEEYRQFVGEFLPEQDGSIFIRDPP